MPNKNITKAAPTIQVAFTQGESEFLYAFDRHLLGKHITKISVGGNMETLNALCGLYGDVTVLQLHYHLEMFPINS